MIKHISLIHRHANESIADFREYWLNVHSQLVKGVLPGLRKYVANFPVELGGATGLGSGQYLECDAIIELHFDSLDALQVAMRSEGWCGERRKASSARLMDLSRNRFLVGEEVLVDLV